MNTISNNNYIEGEIQEKNNNNITIINGKKISNENIYLKI